MCRPLCLAVLALVGTASACGVQIERIDEDPPNVTPDAGAEPDADTSDDPHDMNPLTDEGLTTLAGTDLPGYRDGARDRALFNNPVNVMVVGEEVIVADFYNNSVRAVNAEGTVRTVFTGPGFSRPFGLATRSGRLWVQTDRDSSGAPTGAIWVIDLATGNGSVAFEGIGRLRGMAPLPGDRFAVTDSLNHWVGILHAESGRIEVLAGTPGEPGRDDGTGATARFNRPTDIVLSPTGSLWVADSDNHLIREVSLEGEVSTLAGSGREGATDGPATEASISYPSGLALRDDGVLFIGEREGGKLRRFANGQVTTLIGAEPGFVDSTKSSEGRLFATEGIDLEGDYLYLSGGNGGTDAPHHRVRRLRIDEE